MSAGTGSFYIVGNTIHPSHTGLGHPALWREVVAVYGKALRLSLDDRLALLEAPYGCPRGRICRVEGKLVIYGHPSCRKHLGAIRKLFCLPKSTPFAANDPHYRQLLPMDQAIVRSILSAVLNKKENV